MELPVGKTTWLVIDPNLSTVLRFARTDLLMVPTEVRNLQ
jgi:hypothetical protein